MKKITDAIAAIFVHMLAADEVISGAKRASFHRRSRSGANNRIWDGHIKQDVRAIPR